MQLNHPKTTQPLTLKKLSSTTQVPGAKNVGDLSILGTIMKLLTAAPHRPHAAGGVHFLLPSQTWSPGTILCLPLQGLFSLLDYFHSRERKSFTQALVKSAMKTNKQTDCKKHPDPVLLSKFRSQPCGVWAGPLGTTQASPRFLPCPRTSVHWSLQCSWPLLLKSPSAPVAVRPRPSRETSRSGSPSRLALPPCLLKH